jgi:hypothetical protein
LQVRTPVTPTPSIEFAWVNPSQFQGEEIDAGCDTRTTIHYNFFCFRSNIFPPLLLLRKGTQIASGISNLLPRKINGTGNMTGYGVNWLSLT